MVSDKCKELWKNLDEDKCLSARDSILIVGVEFLAKLLEGHNDLVSCQKVKYLKGTDLFM